MNDSAIGGVGAMLLVAFGPGAAGAQDRGPEPAQPASAALALLEREWSFSGIRCAGTRYYTLENTHTEIAPDGSRGEPTSYRLWIEVRAEPGAADPGDEPTSIACVSRKVTIAKGAGAPRGVPALKDYEYELYLGVDAERELFGIEHATFNGLVDDAQRPLDFLDGFLLYGSFIDFHMFDTFTARGQGEFDSDLGGLRRIGQRETTDVGTELPIHLEPGVLAGSKFKNGSTTIAFEGLTLAGGVACALLGIESSDASFDLILAPMPGLRMNAIGGSTYSGDLCLELESQWMNRLEFREFVVSKITMGTQDMGSSVTERRVQIQSVPEAEFRKGLN